MLEILFVLDSGAGHFTLIFLVSVIVVRIRLGFNFVYFFSKSYSSSREPNNQRSITLTTRREIVPHYLFARHCMFVCYFFKVEELFSVTNRLTISDLGNEICAFNSRLSSCCLSSVMVNIKKNLHNLHFTKFQVH